MMAHSENCITLPNGIVLDPDGGWAAGLREYAALKGFPGWRAFLAVFPGGEKRYILVDGEDVIREDTSYEAMCVFIEMMWADRTMPR